MNYSTLAWLSCCLLAVEGFTRTTTATSKTAFVGQPFAFRPSSSSSSRHAAWRMDLEEPFATTKSEFLKRYQVPLPTLQTELQIPKVTHHAAVDDEIDAALARHGLPWRSSIDATHVVPSDSDSGLFYMPFFEWQLQFMRDNLTNLRVIPTESEATGEDLSYVEAVERPCRMVTLCFASDEYRKIRMTVYDAGNRTQVFTSLWYPQPEYDLPVLGIDLLQFHQDRHLCVVDFQPLHDNQQESYEHLLEPIRSQYPSLQGQMTKRFYDETRFFSNQMLYSRFEELHGNKNNVATTEEHPAYRDLFPAYQQYVQTHLNLLRSTTPHTENIPTVVKGQAAYDTYSADRDPAHAMFAKVFGQEFADAFVYDVLFAYSEGKERQQQQQQK